MVLVAAALGLSIPVVGQAQGFGRNKVQYETLQFQVLNTLHFRVFFYPEERAAALGGALITAATVIAGVNLWT
jgi:hypothetical protein